MGELNRNLESPAVEHQARSTDRRPGCFREGLSRASTERCDPRLLETQRAFDGVASEYDRSNAANPLLCAMRARSRAIVDRFVPPGASILDLGCGPGADEEYFVRRGYAVSAIDWSPAMVDEARRRLDNAGLADSVSVRQLGIHEIAVLAPARFDVVYSSFGTLNCVTDMTSTAERIADRLHPGGLLIASVIGRTCPWEIAFYMARGDWARATVRYARDMVPVPLEGKTVWTRYYSPRRFEAAFAAAGFTRVYLRALALCAPPPYLQGFARRHPKLLSLLGRVDDRVGRWPLFRAWGDHFLIVLKRGVRAETAKAESQKYEVRSTKSEVRSQK